MEDPVISETGRYAISEPVTLVEFGGNRIASRGVWATLPQSAAQLEGSFSDSGATARVLYRTTPGDSRLEFMEVEGERWRVLHAEDRSASYWRAGDRRTWFLQLVGPVT